MNGPRENRFVRYRTLAPKLLQKAYGRPTSGR